MISQASSAAIQFGQTKLFADDSINCLSKMLKGSTVDLHRRRRSRVTKSRTAGSNNPLRVDIYDKDGNL